MRNLFALFIYLLFLPLSFFLNKEEMERRAKGRSARPRFPQRSLRPQRLPFRPQTRDLPAPR